MPNLPKRQPNGLASSKPIALRLPEDERIDAERIAKEKRCSLSALASAAYRAGLPLVLDQSPSEPPVATALSGGAAPAAASSSQ